METSYVIKKLMVDARGNKTHVLLTDSQSELLEVTTLSEAQNLVNILNHNSDSGWVYDLMIIKKNDV
jgi:hypothetical protein